MGSDESVTIYLLGIEGIRDIFMGRVKVSIHLDYVHPTRLGMHGGIFAKAAFWEESLWSDADNLQQNMQRSRGPQDRQEECQNGKQQRREGQAGT